MSRPAEIDSVLIVVPARDEEPLIAECLRSIRRAVACLQARHAATEVGIVVVADLCRDNTVDIARREGALVLEVRHGCVGAARRAGVDMATRTWPSAPERTWLASTDADTRVPPGWLTHMLEQAAEGARLTTGRAVPDPLDLTYELLQRWHELHLDTTPGAHVHGANLGLRLDAYLLVGGWPALTEHEDRHLVEALLAARLPAASGLDVTTSGRRAGRTPGGFAAYLQHLDEIPSRLAARPSP